MIEGGWGPGSRRVALGAIVIKVVSRVIWIGHTGKVRLMTSIAGCWCSGVRRCMAGDTGKSRMCARQWERGAVMIEIRRCPSRSCVTGSAVVIKICQHMVGVGNCLVIGLVA